MLRPRTPPLPRGAAGLCVEKAAASLQRMNQSRNRLIAIARLRTTPFGIMESTLWGGLLRCLPYGAFRSLVALYCRLHAVHPHGITIAAPRAWLPVLGKRRELLERAASWAMGGRPMAVHLIASDAESAGGGQ